jgi:hypothetical protein
LSIRGAAPDSSWILGALTFRILVTWDQCYDFEILSTKKLEENVACVSTNLTIYAEKIHDIGFQKVFFAVHKVVKIIDIDPWARFLKKLVEEWL